MLFQLHAVPTTVVGTSSLCLVSFVFLNTSFIKHVFGLMLLESKIDIKFVNADVSKCDWACMMIITSLTLTMFFQLHEVGSFLVLQKHFVFQKH